MDLFNLFLYFHLTLYHDRKFIFNSKNTKVNQYQEVRKYSEVLKNDLAISETFQLYLEIRIATY